jgi:hypothetical protein
MDGIKKGSDEHTRSQILVIKTLRAIGMADEATKAYETLRETVLGLSPERKGESICILLEYGYADLVLEAVGDDEALAALTHRLLFATKATYNFEAITAIIDTFSIPLSEAKVAYSSEVVEEYVQEALDEGLPLHALALVPYMYTNSEKSLLLRAKIAYATFQELSKVLNEVDEDAIYNAYTSGEQKGLLVLYRDALRHSSNQESFERADSLLAISNSPDPDMSGDQGGAAADNTVVELCRSGAFVKALHVLEGAETKSKRDLARASIDIASALFSSALAVAREVERALPPPTTRGGKGAEGSNHFLVLYNLVRFYRDANLPEDARRVETKMDHYPKPTN